MTNEISHSLNVPFDFCHNCPEFEVETIHARSYDNTHFIKIMCGNEEKCQKIHNYLLSQGGVRNEIQTI